ncbi:MAG: hypothetical protein AAGF07_03275 [Patescibacteria group bacterium]
MNPIESLNKVSESKYKEVETTALGNIELTMRKWFGKNFADVMFEDSMFPGLGKEEIQLIENKAQESGLSPLDREIRERAQEARRQALNLKPIHPKFAKMLVQNNLPSIENMSNGLRVSYKRLFEDAVRDGSFPNLAQGNPEVVALARDLVDDSSAVLDRYPYLLSNPEHRRKHGASIAGNSEVISDPYILQDEQIRQGYLDAGGDISQIINMNNQAFALQAEKTVQNQLQPTQETDQQVEAAITIGLRAVNQEFIAKDDLTRYLIDLQNNELDIRHFNALPTASHIPLTAKNCVDFKQLNTHQQKFLVKYLKDSASLNEFGTNASDSAQIITEIKAMSYTQLAQTNVGQEVIEANGAENFDKKYSPQQRLTILQKAVAIRAVAHNKYSGSLTQTLIDHNSRTLSEGIQNGQRSAAIYTILIGEIKEALGSNNFYSESLRQKIGVKYAIENLQNLSTTGQGTISSVLKLDPADKIYIQNDNFLSTSNPRQRIRNFAQLSFALAQATHSNQTTKTKGINTISNLLHISHVEVERLLLKFTEAGTDLVRRKIMNDNNGQVDISSTKLYFVKELENVKRESRAKFMKGLEEAQSKVAPEDFRNIVDSIDIHNSAYLN